MNAVRGRSSRPTISNRARRAVPWVSSATRTALTRRHVKAHRHQARHDSAPIRSNSLGSRDDHRRTTSAPARPHQGAHGHRGAKEFDRTLATFNGHPRYEFIPTKQVSDGDDEVMTYYLTTHTAFPDQRHENASLHVIDDAVIVEFDLLGTNLGDFYGLPPTGKAFAGEWITNERIYFDTATLVNRIGGSEVLRLPGGQPKCTPWANGSSEE